MLSNASQQFEFINLSERHQIIDVNLKRRVRAHAMRDFRSRKGSSEVCDDQGFVKSNPDITRAMRQPSKSRRNRSDQSDGDAMPISPQTLPGDSPSVVDMPMQIGDLQHLTPNRYDSQEESVDIEDRTPDTNLTMFRFDRAALARHDTAIARHTRKQARRSKTKDLLSSPTTSGSSDSDSLDQPQSPSEIQVQFGKCSDLLSIARVPGASTDPFNAFPIASTPRVQALMHHCKLINTKDRASSLWNLESSAIYLSLLDLMGLIADSWT